MQVNDNSAAIPPTGFELRNEGLYFGEDEKDWVCSAIKVLAYTRDEHSANWGRLVSFEDLDGYLHTLVIAMDLMIGDCSELYSLLLSHGLRVNTKRSIRNKLPEYLQNIKLSVKALCTSRIGWHGDYFILPEGAIPPTGTIYLQTDNHNFAGFKASRTLEEWQDNVAKPCQSNSRLIFAICCAFASPLMPSLNAESGGFNLKGTSSIGKSTALHVAASVWGSPKYTQQWKAISNALEAVAEAHNNALLCLDELGQIDGKDAAEIAYMLANGSGKNRLRARGGLQKRFEWQLMFLSTGEISISDKVYDAGKKAPAGILTRIVDIPADPRKGHGIFDTVGAFDNGNRLAHHLKEQVARYYGTPIRKYLHQLALNKEQLVKVAERANQEFLSKYVKEGVDGQVQRVARRFAMLVTAGYLAIDYHILPYTKEEVLTAIGECFQAWLEERGTTGAYELEHAIKQVRGFFQTHASSRFAVMPSDYEMEDPFANSTQDKIINQAGFKRKTATGDYEFFVFPETFRKEVCQGLNPILVCHELEKLGILKRGSKKKFTKSQRLPTGKAYVYHLLPNILTEPDDNLDAEVGNDNSGGDGGDKGRHN
ncbi:MAG: DUF927 domain-containing protein [Proteobacteria bacterium]|nr:DUF927 domain-containing protein [Pseudomonadota bacterium]